MRTALISLGVGLLVVALVYVSIFFLDPGMNVEKALNIIVYSFVASALLTTLVLALRRRR